MASFFKQCRRCHKTYRKIKAERPDQLRLVKPWLVSQLPGQSSMRDRSPWISYDARVWLDSVVEESMRVFEWGSGGSTLYFADHVASLISIGHDPAWYAMAKKIILGEHAAKCTYRLVEPALLSDDSELLSNDDKTTSCRSIRDNRRNAHYGEYVGAIDAYDDASFDLVMIDGRARTSCLSKAIAKVRPGGWIVLDNSSRDDYAIAHELMAGYETVSFQGLTPGVTHMTSTTGWRV